MAAFRRHDRALHADDGRLEAGMLPVNRHHLLQMQSTITSKIVARLDELPTPIWIALAVLAFVFWWPLGLAILAYGL
jgi:hypothetical protein